ncbi:DUF5677 domain-containing protein [Cupriavidus plantarum]|uniref:Uncharacterized protein n=1 Tax=Cupriavidus plantarum TaxID=942865 RepID=A0A316EP36_9BURK|nr:DUF5677 domain-containing protein [Cupriavidus plantarum]PWK33471.1 hypothetical protein C7419_104146 [Cupriavidus plantarum]
MTHKKIAERANYARFPYSINEIAITYGAAPATDAETIVQRRDRTERRNLYAELFAKADNLKNLARRLSDYLCTRQFPDHQVIAVAMWIRCVSACETTLLLAERGQPVEAASVLRSGVEHMFWGCALLQRPEVHEWLRNNEREQKRKQGARMSRHKLVRQSVTEAQRRYLKEKASEPEIQTKSVEQAAESAGMEVLFDAAYRGLSLMGVHAGLSSTAFSVQHGRLTHSPTDEQLHTLLTTLDMCLSEGYRQLAAFANELAPPNAVSTPTQQQAADGNSPIANSEDA